ncbi:MAG: hypothetical protein HOI53_02325 [Francisellaceae bacterium]|jgi:hypothetical protein|nr:hypothetical protein [Francisellaceae bacterium]MBT6206838.1 hypothetical protein [Francisellaceae bacterium]MBT6538707.1 hypothetical protein [Francisellaceae bacterium]
MSEKTIKEKIAEVAKTFLETAKAVATSSETKAALTSAKETIGNAVKSGNKKNDTAAPESDASPKDQPEAGSEENKDKPKE